MNFGPKNKMKRTLTQDIQNGTLGMKSAKYKGIVHELDKSGKEETELQTLICKWLNEKNIRFISDFAAGLKLSKQTNTVRLSQACDYKMPDIYIFCGQKPLIIEIKVKLSDLFLVDGMTLKSEHVQLQYDSILDIRKHGCVADFGVGEYDIKSMVMQHLAGFTQYKNIKPFRQLTKQQKIDNVADDFFNQFNL